MDEPSLASSMSFCRDTSNLGSSVLFRLEPTFRSEPTPESFKAVQRLVQALPVRVNSVNFF
jgi:hypothetical protein